MTTVCGGHPALGNREAAAHAIHGPKDPILPLPAAPLHCRQDICRPHLIDRWLSSHPGLDIQDAKNDLIVVAPALFFHSTLGPSGVCAVQARASHLYFRSVQGPTPSEPAPRRLGPGVRRLTDILPPACCHGGCAKSGAISALEMSGNTPHHRKCQSNKFH